MCIQIKNKGSKQLKSKFRDLTVTFLVRSKIASMTTFLLDKQETLVSIPILDKLNNKLKNILDKNHLATEGFTYSSKKVDFSTKEQGIRVVYAVHNSLPETNNGYAIRTHYIAKSIQFENIDIYPVTRVGFPYDLPNITNYFENKEALLIDSLQYYRLDKKGYHWDEVTISAYLKNYASMLADFSKDKHATIIHSASSYVNGLAAVNAGKILNIPSIYEVRGFWEITRASREKGFKQSESYKMQKRLETQACKDATSVIALSEIVKEELINRGIEKEKIYVVPNGVNTDTLIPKEKDQELLLKLGWEGKFVVGFIGSVVDYEGLPLLIKAAEKIYQSENDNIRYLIVGDGNDLENLKLEVEKRSLSHLFMFTGRVPYEEVEHYYSIIDIACYPRLNWEVCSIVSPKKPFEAMAYGIPVISSSVHANSYFIDDGVTGLVHSYEDVDSIVEKIDLLYRDSTLREKITKNARDWVVQNRDSKITGPLMKKIYLETLEKHHNINQKT